MPETSTGDEEQDVLSVEDQVMTAVALWVNIAGVAEADTVVVVVGVTGLDVAEVVFEDVPPPPPPPPQPTAPTIVSYTKTTAFGETREAPSVLLSMVSVLVFV